MEKQKQKKFTGLSLRIEEVIQWVLTRIVLIFWFGLLGLYIGFFSHSDIFTIIEGLLILFISAPLIIDGLFACAPWFKRIEYPFGLWTVSPLLKSVSDLVYEVKEHPRNYFSIHLTSSFFTISSFFVILEFIMYPIYNIIYLLAFVILCISSFILLLIYPSIRKNLIERITGSDVQYRIMFNGNAQQKDIMVDIISWKMILSIMYSGMVTLLITTFSINHTVTLLNSLTQLIFPVIILLLAVSFIIFLYYFYKKIWLISNNA